MKAFLERNKKSFLIFIGFLLALNIFAWQEVFALAETKDLKVEFFDVGQGDSIFVKTPEGHQILIDGGPGSAVLEKLAKNMPFWDRSLDLVILTHPESDHMQGLMDVLQRYNADYFLWSGVVRYTPEYKKLVEILDKKKNSKIKIITAELGQRIKIGEAIIDVLYPFENLGGRAVEKTSNDACVISRLVFGNNSFLFTGDMSSGLEKDLVNSKVGLISDVLKVAHHGSKYSTSDLFLQSVSPKMAVISVGADNSYGHPTPETLQKLKNYDIKTLRTDQSGDIEILSDGKNIKIN